MDDDATPIETANKRAAGEPERKAPAKPLPPETGGPEGPEPTRFGDWEKKGRCIDF